jgi:hypothetical protein
MRPIQFTATAILTLSPEQIADRIAAVETWSDFRGYGIVPGIRSARYEWSTDSLEGARIRVENLNGSVHLEEILRWDVPRSIVMRIFDLPPPLLRGLAEEFLEEWTFEEREDGTSVRRTFTLFPRGTASRAVLWIVSLFLREAVTRHLRQLGSVRPRRVPA